jgi:hypothetical protein
VDDNGFERVGFALVRPYRYVCGVRYIDPDSRVNEYRVSSLGFASAKDCIDYMFQP